jgi:hypothetical protein
MKYQTPWIEAAKYAISAGDRLSKMDNNFLYLPCFSKMTNKKQDCECELSHVKPGLIVFTGVSQLFFI